MLLSRSEICFEGWIASLRFIYRAVLNRFEDYLLERTRAKEKFFVFVANRRGLSHIFQVTFPAFNLTAPFYHYALRELLSLTDVDSLSPKRPQPRGLRIPFRNLLEDNSPVSRTLKYPRRSTVARSDHSENECTVRGDLDQN